jgi:hypothetical protein
MILPRPPGSALSVITPRTEKVFLNLLSLGLMFKMFLN